MKRQLTLIAIVSCFAFSASYVHADDGKRHFFNSLYCFFFACESNQDLQEREETWEKYDRSSDSSSDRKSVPELDGSAAPVAAALILGLAGLGIERRRRKRAKAAM